MENQLYLSEATDLLDGCIPDLLGLINREDGWDDLGENDGVRGSQMMTPEGKQLIRSVGVINHTPEEIAEFVLDISKKKRWDGMSEEISIVKEFDQNFKIIYESFYAPWPVSHRDFVYAIKVFKRDDGVLLIAKSINAGVPERRGVVRGEIIVSGFYLKSLGPSATNVTYLVSVDPKGSLPGFIVNMLGKKQSSNVNKIRHVMH
jgi:START domain